MDGEAKREALERLRVLRLHGRDAEGMDLARRLLSEAKAAGDAELAAEASHRLGDFLWELFRHREAWESYQEALAGWPSGSGAGELRPMLTRSCLAALAARLDRPEAADLAERLRAELPPDPAADAERTWLAHILKNLGTLRMRGTKPAEALPLLTRALALLEGCAAPDELEIASGALLLSKALRRAGRARAAAGLLDRALEIRRRLLGEGHPYVGFCEHQLGEACLESGDFDGARKHLSRALEILERALGPAHPCVSVELSALATVEIISGQEAQALSLAQRALDADVAFFGPEHPEVAGNLQLLAMVHAKGGRPAAAAPLWLRAVKVLAPLYRTRARDLVHCTNNLWVTLRAQGKHDEILAVARGLLTGWEGDAAMDPELLANVWIGESEVWFRRDRPQKAEKLLRRALSAMEKHLGPNAPHLDPILHNLAAVLRTMGRGSEAAELEKRRARLKVRDN
ncbi:MAG: tetratricopeptide repeat protein [Planctomycetes bacterium]|nr:tetratricopeptide repeat protein [Planctomycetota bacterium]